MHISYYHDPDFKHPIRNWTNKQRQLETTAYYSIKASRKSILKGLYFLIAGVYLTINSINVDSLRTVIGITSVGFGISHLYKAKKYKDKFDFCLEQKALINEFETKEAIENLTEFE